MHLGTAFVALAALFWGLSGGIGAILMADGWDPFTVSFYRGAIGLLFVLVWLLIYPRGSGLNNLRLWFWSVLAGLGVAGTFSFYFLSIEEGNIAVAATLLYCAPVYVYLVSFVLKLETPSAFKWAAMALVMLGVVLLTRIYNIGANNLTLLGVATGVLAGISYAVFIFGFKYAAPHGSPQAILSIAFTVLVLTLFWPSDTEQIIAALTSRDWPLFIMLGILGAGVSFVFYIIGLKHTAPAVAAIIAMIEPVTAAIFGVALLNDTLTIMQVLGMVLILTTVVALSLHSAKTARSAGA